MHNAVPNLTTAQTSPLLRFESLLLEQATDIESWFRQQWQKSPAPFYTSVDLRNAGYKLAPVDTNLFPAGFNNLNPAFEPLCIQALQAGLERLMPSACHVVLVPENHTRNLYYLEAVATLQNLIQKAGYKVRLGSMIPDLAAAQSHTLPSGRTIVLEPLKRDGDRVSVEGFKPCLVLLHNDLSGGLPAILEGLSQPVVPSLKLGWHQRLKSQHFAHYHTVTEEFAKLLGIDPWWINPLFRNCGHINFLKREGEECLEGNVEILLDDIRDKYREYGIRDEPFVIVKADAGTYGMGIMTVKSVADIKNMNRDARKKMASAKEGKEVTGAIIQEGVYTHERWQDDDGSPDQTAEPVVYMIDRQVVGGFYRVHGGRDNTENLNAPGAQFRRLAFAECGAHPDERQAPDAMPNRFYAYGVVARLAMLAAARESL
jgi:glutamate--cysteine ligase